MDYSQAMSTLQHTACFMQGTPIQYFYQIKKKKMSRLIPFQIYYENVDKNAEHELKTFVQWLIWL